MLRSLLILGTGPHSLEMAEIVERANQVEPTWELLGFVSASRGGTTERRIGYPVIGGPEVWDEHAEASLLPEFGWPREAEPPRDFPNYEPGSWGPAAAGALPRRDGRSWRVS